MYSAKTEVVKDYDGGLLTVNRDEHNECVQETHALKVCKRLKVERDAVKLADYSGGGNLEGVIRYQCAQTSKVEMKRCRLKRSRSG